MPLLTIKDLRRAFCELEVLRRVDPAVAAGGYHRTDRVERSRQGGLIQRPFSVGADILLDAAGHFKRVTRRDANASPP